MNHRIRRLVAGSMLVVAIAACDPAPTNTPTAPPASGAPTASSGASAAAGSAAIGSAAAGEPFGIRAAAIDPDACMDALISGTLARNLQSGLGITNPDGEQTPVEWPFRYSARIEDGRVSLLDETGKVVAREGDQISMGGGFGNQFWHGCAPVTVGRAPS